MYAEIDWAPCSPLMPQAPPVQIDRPPNVGLSSVAQSVPWENFIADRIVDLMKLPTGWDGYGGRALTRGAAFIAMNILASFCKSTTPMPSLVPMANGGVQIEWHFGAIDLEIAINSPGRISVFYCDDRVDGDGEEFDLKSDFGPLLPLVNKLDRTA